MEARVAVLERIAASTEALLTETRDDVRAIRDKQEADYRGLYAKIDSDYRALNTTGTAAAVAVAFLVIGLAGVMAKGFKWF